MSYLALARKWRPRTFSQLVGQEHVTQALIHSLDAQRIHHAYLYSGTRGVGKTSVARIMAKSLNCEQGISANPCLQCETCLAIEQGRFIDLIEVDAASKTRIEETRELLDNVQYAPTSGRFKIFLIDEVHMLSQHSFNALLKTLEEPPEHVKFLLATTDPQKLPVTILSRCLQFNLKHLSPEVIEAQLNYIASQENQACDPKALTLLAKAAQGSMRDALSLFDQVLAGADTLLTEQRVRHILGYSQQDYAVKLLQALMEHNATALIDISRQVASEGGHFSYVFNQLLETLHEITLCQHLPNEHPLLQTSAEVKQLAVQMPAEDAQLFYQIAVKGSQDMLLAPTLSLGFEMTLLRMLTFMPAPQQPRPTMACQRPQPDHQSAIDQSNANDAGFEHHSDPLPPSSPSSPTLLPPVGEGSSTVVEERTSEPNSNLQTDRPEDWSAILPRLNLSGLALSAVDNAAFVSKNDKIVSLNVSTGHLSLFTPAVIKRVEQALGHYYQETIKINLVTDKENLDTPALKKQQAQQAKQGQAESSMENDPFIQQLQEEFSAELVKNSIAPVKECI